MIMRTVKAYDVDPFPVLGQAEVCRTQNSRGHGITQRFQMGFYDLIRPAFVMSPELFHIFQQKRMGGFFFYDAFNIKK